MQNIEYILSRFVDCQHETILMGDFNVDLRAGTLNSMNAQTRSFLNTTKLYNLKQIIDECTRITEHSRTLID